jgi:hypothetical protein
MQTTARLPTSYSKNWASAVPSMSRKLFLPQQPKPSPGKGNGISATKDVSVGTLILDDNKLMVIRTAPHQTVSDGQVRRAFCKFSAKQQKESSSMPESTCSA